MYMNLHNKSFQCKVNNKQIVHLCKGYENALELGIEKGGSRAVQKGYELHFTFDW